MSARRWSALLFAATTAACGSPSTPAANGGELHTDGGGASDASPYVSPIDDAGSTSDAAPSPDAAPEAGPAPHALCAPSRAWPTINAVPSVAAAGFDRFGAASLDELTVAWWSKSDGAVYVADRAAVGADFGAAQKVDTGAIAIASDRVALAPSGLEIVAALADGSSFVAFDRASRGAAWAASSTLAFDDLRASIVESGGRFSEPVLGGDKRSLFYLLAIGTSAPALYESTWDATNHKWTVGATFANPELAIASVAQRRRPTGAAADGRTLFYFDEVSQSEHAAWRDTPSSPFNFFRDLGALADATPNAKCTRLYFASPSLATAE